MTSSSKRKSPDELRDKILANIKVVGDCWVWQKSFGSHGYGNIATGGSLNETVHRVSYEVFNGRIPAKAVIMHSCDNKKCCNPEHLSIGNQSKNMSDALNGKRRSSPLSDDVRNYILSSRKSTKELSDELGLRYCRVYKLRKGWTF